jgi:carboxyl-terminal processing protease
MLPRAGAVAAVIAVAACAAGPDSLFTAGSTEKLYARGLDEITALYVTPVSARQLALAGAGQLHRLDGAVDLSERQPGEAQEQLALRYDGREIAAPASPPTEDAREWGNWLAGTVAAARQASPTLAALPAERLDKAVFDGFTSKLDRYSRYSPPDLARSRRAARDGFGGIGVTLDGGDQFRIAEVVPQGPADRAGIRPDDKVTAIDGVPTAGRPTDEIVQEMRGAVATPVTVTIARAGFPEPREFRVERALITAPTVTLTDARRTAIVRVTNFNHTTRDRLAESLKDAEAKVGGRLDGIILDLRGNPGGLLDQAVGLADLFLPEGPISAAVGRNPASRQYFTARGDSIAGQTPMAVLINGDSASSSEIVAAALQDRGRAVVIGSSSYGKGTIQTVVHLPNEAELTVTWAYLLSPSGYLLQGHGVVPTLCTADLGSDDQALQSAVQRARAGPAASGAAMRARASLDENGWAALRRACPRRSGRPAIDIKLAEQLLADPKLYQASLHAIRAAGRLAPGAGPAAGPSLTEAGGALSSSFRTP